MANNPYLDNNNPYLNGYTFNEDGSQKEPTKSVNNKTAGTSQTRPYSSTQQNIQPSKTNNKNNAPKEFDILDASTFVNADPKPLEEGGEPYKEIKRKGKDSKPKKEKFKEKQKFNPKSFFLGIGLAIVVCLTSLSFTIIGLYNNLTFGRIQSLINTNLTDGDITEYTIKDIVALLQDYNSINIGSLEKLLGFNLDNASEDIHITPLLDELSTRYLRKSYKQVKISELQNSVNTIIDEITIDHFADILSRKDSATGKLVFFKEEILNTDLCEALVYFYSGKNIKLKTFFGENLNYNLNYITVGKLLEKVYKLEEDASKIEKFIYETFKDSNIGIYDLFNNFNDEINNLVQVKDIVNSFIEEDSQDAFLNIIKTTYSEDTTGITSFIDNFSEHLNKIKLSTIVKSLWPDLNEENLNTSYDGFIKLIYDIYSKAENNIGIMDFANNISAQLNYIKVSNVIAAFFSGDSKVEEFIRSVFGDYTEVGLGEFIDNFMGDYINDISITNILQTFIENDNKFLTFIKSIYSDEKYENIGISEFIENFVSDYSKDITLGKVINFIVPENVNEQQQFEKLLLSLWGESETALFDVFADLPTFLDKTYIKDFSDALLLNDIISDKLYNLITASISDSEGNILEKFNTMGTYTYFTNITEYINNITIDEILENTENLPEIVVKLLKLLGEKGIMDAIEDPLTILTGLTINDIAQIYFETSNENKEFADTNTNKIPDSFDSILNIEIEAENATNQTPTTTLGEITLKQFLDNRELYLDKITVAHLLEFLNETGSLKGLNEHLYNLFKTELGDKGLIDFKNNASTYLTQITVQILFDTLEKIGSFEGFVQNKKDFIIDFITDKFGSLEIKNFFDNFSTHLNDTTIIEFKKYMYEAASKETAPDGTVTLTHKTEQILFDIIDEAILNIKQKNINNFKSYLNNSLTKDTTLTENEKLWITNNLENIGSYYATNTLDEKSVNDFDNNENIKNFILTTARNFETRKDTEENIATYGKNELLLNTFFNNFYEHISNLTVENFCNIFDVKITNEDGEILTIYGKVLNRLKNTTLQDLIDNPETTLETSLKDVINGLSIGEAQDFFNINILNIFKCYDETTPLKTVFDNFNDLSIGDIIGNTNSSIMQKFTGIKLSELTNIETTLKQMYLGELSTTNDIVKNITPSPTQEDINTAMQSYFAGKYIRVLGTSTYYVYDNTTNQFITTSNIDGLELILEPSAIGDDEIKKAIYNSLNIYSEMNFDRYFSYDGIKLTQIKSNDNNIDPATVEEVETFENITLTKGTIYKLKAETSNKYYKYNFSTGLWDSATYINSHIVLHKTYNAFDEALKFVEENNKNIENSNYIPLLKQDAIHMHDFYMVYNGELFEYSSEFTENTSFLAALKHKKLCDILDAELTVGDVFGENSKIVKLLGNDSTVKLSEIDDALNISSLTLTELGNLGLLDISKVHNNYKNLTLQQILDTVLNKAIS